MILSPSALKTFVQCPYKFKQTYVTKELTYQQNDAAKRGERLHKKMETACNYGWDMANWNDKMSEPYAKNFTDTVWTLKKQGWKIKTEYGIGTDGVKAVDFWDKSDDNKIRCRIDLFAYKPDTNLGIVLDWKTGKKYEADKLQLQVNAICLKAATGITNYNVGFMYLDSGDYTYENIDVTNFNINETDSLAWANSPCLEFLEAYSDTLNALERQRFIQTPNRFCKWCDSPDCPHKK